jgi:purine-binding chemotaxis protein CheW
MKAQFAASDNYVLFDIAGTSYAVHSQLVQQIEMIDHITPLPNAPAFVDGVVFTRGQVIPALNLRARFGFERVPHTTRTRLLVVSSNSRMVGLIVDTAREFLAIPAESIQPPGESLVGMSGDYLTGIVTVGERIILVVNLEEVIRLSEALEEIRGRA